MINVLDLYFWWCKSGKLISGLGSSFVDIQIACVKEDKKKFKQMFQKHWTMNFWKSFQFLNKGILVINGHIQV